MWIEGSYMLNNKVESSLNNKKVNSLTHKLFKSKKAISPILATLLLVVIAVAAIVVTYAWIMTYMAHLTGQAGVVLYKANVNFYGNGTKIDIDIGNSGTSDTTIIQVYVGTSSSAMDNQTITPVLTPGRHCSENNSELFLAKRGNILFQSANVNRPILTMESTSTNIS